MERRDSSPPVRIRGEECGVSGPLAPLKTGYRIG